MELHEKVKDFAASQEFLSLILCRYLHRIHLRNYGLTLRIVTGMIRQHHWQQR